MTEIQEFDVNEKATCAVTGKTIPIKYMTLTEDRELIDKALHSEASMAMHTVLLTLKNVEHYYQLKGEFRSQLLLTARVLRKMVSDKAELKDVLVWFKQYEYDMAFNLFNFDPRCMDMFQHLCVLKQFESEYGWIDEKVAILAPLKTHGGSIPEIIEIITKEHKYTEWVSL